MYAVLKMAYVEQSDPQGKGWVHCLYRGPCAFHMCHCTDSGGVGYMPCDYVFW